MSLTRKTTSSQRLRVVVACAEPDATQAARVARAVRERGARVELVSGIDTDVHRLEQAVDQFGDRALYVLCHSEALDRYQGDLLELTVKAGEVGPGRLLSAWFDPRDPAALIASVLGRLERLEGGTANTHSEPLALSLAGQGVLSASISLPSTTLSAAHAVFGQDRVWRAFAVTVALAALATFALHFAL